MSERACARDHFRGCGLPEASTAQGARAMEKENQKQKLMVLMKGHPGCAKSTVARALAAALRWPVVDKDDIRDATLALEAPDRPAPPAPTALNALSYEVMWRVVETQLQIGLSVVVDCPLARASLFRTACALALKHGAAPVVVECVALDVHEWRRRLEARAQLALAVPKCDADCASSAEGNRPGNDDDGTRALKNWHKPSRWDDVQKLLEGYAKCYEYDTGLTRKLIVDTTALPTAAAVCGIENWLRSVEEPGTAIVTCLP